jgi:hypothetical protein
MPTWAGTPVQIMRMLGQVDQDDPTNLPVGCAAVCKNIDFTRDATGAGLSATTRAGNCMIAQGVKSPGTGLWDFQYEPEAANDPFFQQLLRFSMSGTLEREYPVGTGRMTPVPAGLFVPPTNSHKIDAQTANLVFSSYSNLKTPTAGCSGYNPKTLNLDPLGMKPFGFSWTPATFVYKGEVVTPSISNSGQQGNGHTYQAQNSGWTSQTADGEPAWPLTENGTVTEVNVVAGQTPVEWEELTMVIANRIPAPNAPLLTLTTGGSFPAAQTVYIFLTMTNGMGETIAGTTASITTTAAGQAVNVSIPTLASLAGWLSQLLPPYSILTANVYEADASGGQIPPQSSFELVGSFALGATATVTDTATSGTNVPTLNSARITPGQLPAPIVEPVLTRVSAGQTVLPPGAPDLSLVAAGGTFPTGQSVYVLLTLTNSFGQTTAGAIASITTTAGTTGIRVSLASSYGPTVTGVNIYEADVVAGSAAPTVFQLVGSFALGASPVITATAVGVNPPADNTATLPVGTFPAGRDIWVRLSYSNNLGETPLGPSNSIINTLADDAVQVTLSAVQEFPQLMVINIYEADVPTGAVEPPINAYSLVGSFGVTDVVFITETATGKAPVTVNGTGPGGNVAADTSDGGINATQGYRYAVPAWMNRNETISGFTVSAASRYIVDEDGWEIAVFNVAIGPPNIIGRVINWTEADSSQDGPYAWVGLVDLQIPSQNQVYPKSFLSDGITIIPTVFLDNITTTGTFNFTDEFLTGEDSVSGGGNNTTDRLTLGQPPQSVRVDYSITADALIHAGVAGWTSGLVISLRGDYESYDASGSFLPIRTNSGEVCWGVVEYRNVLYAMRERSGIVVTPGTGMPNTWSANARWSADGGNGVGPCGPRAFACNGQFIIFVHRSGMYRYDGQGAPDLMTKEIPREWGAINWAAATTICVTIDDDTHTVRLQVPVGRSLVPNKEYCLSYLEGWLNPIHFSTFSQKEISQEAARRWSFNDVSAYICKRIYRTAANIPPLPLGPDGTSQMGSDFYQSQLAYTTVDQSGIINARTPGRFDDNGAGIDCKFMTQSASDMQKQCKPEGVTTSIVGFGPVNVSFLQGRQALTGNNAAQKLLPCTPMILSPDDEDDFTRKPNRRVGTYWKILYDNGAQPGVWFSIKKAVAYVIPVRAARGSSS